MPSRNLSWINHINCVESKVRSTLNLVCPFKYKLDRYSLRMYLSLIRPLVEYGDVVLDEATQSDLEKLDKLQYDSARLVTGATARINAVV